MADRPFINSPFDTQSVAYSYGGQMAPETAIAEQALNRRRLLANMLTQQGLQPQQGRMVGRFYVAPSPMQGGAGLAQVLAGTLGNRMIDSQQGDLMAKDRQMVADAISQWKARQTGQAPESAAPSQAPPQAPEQPHPAPPSLPDGAGPGPTQNIGPRPQSLPDQHTGVSDFKARPDTLQFGQNPQGLSQEVTPGDMSTMVNSADPAKAQAQLGDQPPMQPPAQVAPVAPPAPMPQAGPRKTTMDDLAQLMTHQHPQVRAYGQFLAQQMQREQDIARGLDQQTWERGFKERELKQGGELKQLGIESNALTRAESLKNTITMKEMQLAQMERDSLRDAKSQERADALRAEIAKGNQEIARMNAQSQRMNAESQRQRLDPKTRPMSATAQKELIQTEEELQGSHQAIQNLQNALAINNDAMGFTGAGAIASAGSLLPESMRPKSVDATVDLDNLITGSALPQLKAIFGGMPTEGERKVLLELQGSSSKTPAQRKLIFERAIQAANNRIKFSEQKAQQLRSGQYFAGDGGLDTTIAAPNPGMPKAGGPSVGTIEDGYRFKGGNPADPNAWEKVR